MPYEDAAWIDMEEVYRLSAVNGNLSYYASPQSRTTHGAMSYIEAGIPYLGLFFSETEIVGVFFDGESLYILNNSKDSLLQGRDAPTLSLFTIYNQVMSQNVAPDARAVPIRANFLESEAFTPTQSIAELQDILDCEVLTYGTSMYTNLLHIPKSYGDSTVYKILNNLTLQSRIRVRHIEFGDEAQVVAYVDPSNELSFIFSRRGGIACKVSYVEAWWRIYLSTEKPRIGLWSSDP